MNTAVAHAPLPLEYSLSTDHEYLTHGKGIPNHSNDAQDLNGSQRHGRAVGPVGQSHTNPLAVPGQNIYGYTTQQSSLQDASYASTSELLSPPESCSGSGTLSTHSAASPYTYSTLPAVYQNHATGADSFSNASSSFSPQTLLWNDRSMSDQRSQRMSGLPPPTISPSSSPYPISSAPGGAKFPGLGPAPNFSVRPGFPSLAPPDPDSGHYSYPPSRPNPLASHHYSPVQRFDQPHASPSGDASRMGGQDGPPFNDTKVVYPVLTPRSEAMTPNIEAKIQKGFFQVDSKWTCYRRNYFTVTCAFQLKPTVYDTSLFIQRHPNQPLEQIYAFSMQISAKTAAANNQESELRALVQHTPKRDKATETTPGRAILHPAQVSILSTGGSYHGNHPLYTPTSGHAANMMPHYGGSPYNPAQPPGPAQNHTFERIQFQKATANNGKRRAQQQYFHVVVELQVNLSRHDDQWVKIATAESQPMVVRGRSPGHYKDNRHDDGGSSMEPDRTNGAGGDGSGGTQPPGGPFLDPSHGRTGWDSHRGSSQMGGSYRTHDPDFVMESPVSSAGTSDYASPISRMTSTGYDPGRESIPRGFIPRHFLDPQSIIGSPTARDIKPLLPGSGRAHEQTHCRGHSQRSLELLSPYNPSQQAQPSLSFA